MAARLAMSLEPKKNGRSGLKLEIPKAVAEAVGKEPLVVKDGPRVWILGSDTEALSAKADELIAAEANGEEITKAEDVPGIQAPTTPLRPHYVMLELPEPEVDIELKDESGTDAADDGIIPTTDTSAPAAPKQEAAKPKPTGKHSGIEQHLTEGSTLAAQFADLDTTGDLPVVFANILANLKTGLSVTSSGRSKYALRLIALDIGATLMFARASQTEASSAMTEFAKFMDSLELGEVGAEMLAVLKAVILTGCAGRLGADAQVLSSLLSGVNSGSKKLPPTYFTLLQLSVALRAIMDGRPEKPADDADQSAYSSWLDDVSKLLAAAKKAGLNDVLSGSALRAAAGVSSWHKSQPDLAEETAVPPTPQPNTESVPTTEAVEQDAPTAVAAGDAPDATSEPEVLPVVEPAATATDDEPEQEAGPPTDSAQEPEHLIRIGALNHSCTVTFTEEDLAAGKYHLSDEGAIVVGDEGDERVVIPAAVVKRIDAGEGRPEDAQILARIRGDEEQASEGGPELVDDALVEDTQVEDAEEAGPKQMLVDGANFGGFAPFTLAAVEAGEYKISVGGALVKAKGNQLIIDKKQLNEIRDNAHPADLKLLERIRKE